MALSMDEQRVLAEIERRLAAEDPGLAASLTNFRRPGPAAVLRSPRARIIGSLFTVLLVATISLMVYAMIPFRAHGVRLPASSRVTAPSQTQISAAGSGSPGKSSAVASAPASLRKTGTAATARTSGTRQASTRSNSSTGAAARGSAKSKSTTTASAGSSPPQVRAKTAGNH
ncbi:MAG TPA: DUF3040 domain-containing protein [Streptosporangiaceae bacterium]